MCAILSKTIIGSSIVSLFLWFGAVSACGEASTVSAEATKHGSISSSSVSSKSEATSALTHRNQPAKRPRSVTPPARLARLSRHSGSVNGPIEYIVVEPSRAPENTPIVVALHGWGDNPERFASLAEELDLPVRTIVARGRLAGSRSGRSWFPRGTSGRSGLS